ncbi:MAG: hypothetical protein AB8G05_20855 [Oligoflexales bacterium]
MNLRKKAAIFYKKSESQIQESELINIIFESGVSTAETVNQIAGRGVGLDIIRSNIAKLGGTLEIVPLKPITLDEKFSPFKTIISLPEKEIVALPENEYTSSVA